MTSDIGSKTVEGLKIVKHHSILASIAALAPVPIADQIGIGGVQVAMLIRLSDHYKSEIPVEEYANLIAGSLGGYLTGSILQSAASLVKSVPGVGTALGIAIQVPLAYMITYAIGRVFMFLIQEGHDLAHTDRSIIRAKFQEFASEGRQSYSENASSISHNQGNKEYIQANFSEVEEILRPYEKSMKFIIALKEVLQEARTRASENIRLENEIRKMGQEIGGKCNEENKE